MTVNAYLSPQGKSKFWSNDGSPLAFGKLYTFAAGTVTPQATYLDSTSATPNANPVILDFRGECNLFLPPNIAYKYLVTDQFGSQVWTQDQVVIQQLITLYGGVDTGVANAYVLNFTANFTTLTDGIVIYWKASNSNTGPSTLNVNGLGVVPILQQNGNALGISSIVANSIVQVMYIGGNFYLLTAASTIPQTGSFTLVVNGLTAPLSVTATYTIISTTATVTVPYIPGAFSNPSNENTFSLSGIPSFLQPSIAQQVNTQYAQDNGTPLTTAFALFQPGNSNIILYPSAAGTPTSWTASGAKILGRNSLPIALYGTSFSYPLA